MKRPRSNSTLLDDFQSKRLQYAARGLRKGFHAIQRSRKVLQFDTDPSLCRAEEPVAKIKFRRQQALAYLRKVANLALELERDRIQKLRAVERENFRIRAELIADEIAAEAARALRALHARQDAVEQKANTKRHEEVC